MASDKPPLTGREKAAALLITLGGELSADVAKHLSGQFLDQVTAQIAVTQDVAPDQAGIVIDEAWNLSQARQLVAEGGLQYARDMLARAFGPQSVEELLRRARAVREPFDFLGDTDPGYLINFLRQEHPQTVALILAHLNPKMTADLLGRLPSDLRSEVAHRMATMERTTPDVVQELEELLRSKLSSVIEQGTSNVGGVDYVVQVLNQVDRSTERTILDSLDETDPEIADQIKNRMFVFDNIGDLDDRAIQRLLREVDGKDLSLALRGASDHTKERILANMSTRASQMLREEMEVMGPVRVSAVDQAQQRIVNAVRRLEELEEITVTRGTEDALV